MSHKGQESQGTGLRDVFNLLVKAPLERLLSLTFQLGESPEDNIIHALSLIVLQKEAQALSKLQELKDNTLAKHLADKWHMSGGKLEDFSAHCGHFQEFTQESLVALARIFKVLFEQGLCDPLLRNLAYKRALSYDEQRTSSTADLEYDQLREEAKDVCGPQIAEQICSLTDLKSGSFQDPHGSLDEETTTLKVTHPQDQLERAYSLPSPLQVTSLMPSYPTHLEISMPPTASFHDNKSPPETSDKSKLNTPVLPISDTGAGNSPGQSQMSEEPQLKSNESPVFITKKHSGLNETLASSTSDSHTTPTQTNKPNFALPTSTNIVLPKMPLANKIHERNSTEEEEEEEEEKATFYGFVILHAPEDADMAESMRERLETLAKGIKGATYCEDFAIPGRSTLTCVEDAINNTAFTILLLTRNFNARMQEMETNSALINSVKKRHKYNTVIPLLPRENCMPRQSVPLVLQTIVPLEENKNFERKIQKALCLARIKTQEKIWKAEQRVKMQIERQERLQELNQHTRQLIQECERAQFLEREQLKLLIRRDRLLGHNVPPGQYQQPSNIHIENAQYIMIGNDSHMNVDRGGGADKDDSNHKEEEQ